MSGNDRTLQISGRTVRILPGEIMDIGEIGPGGWIAAGAVAAALGPISLAVLPICLIGGIAVNEAAKTRKEREARKLLQKLPRDIPHRVIDMIYEHIENGESSGKVEYSYDISALDFSGQDELRAMFTGSGGSVRVIFQWISVD